MVTLNGTLNVDCGKGIMFAVELHRVHESVIEHVLNRGFKPCLQDCHASITLESCDNDEKKQREMSQAAIAKYVQGLYEGTARVRGVTRESTSDPMSKFRIAALRDLINDSKKWAAINKRDDKVAYIKQLLEKNAAVIEPIAVEMKAEDDRRREKMAELASGIAIEL